MNIARVPLKSDTDLGCITQLADYMNLKRTWLQALKTCANRRHSKDNPTCFTGSRSTKKWVMEWLSRDVNRDFKISLVYPAKKKEEPVAA